VEAELIRRCPGCGSENALSVMRCACGMILAGVDIVARQTAKPETGEQAGAAISEATVICPHDDCGQANPPGSETCLYCNRPLPGNAARLRSETMQSLINLPSALMERYRIVKPMPTRGAEAELLIVQDTSGGPQRVAKIYRHGILPKREVQERIDKIPLAHRVALLEEGVSDGYAYELMELCEHGSLRQMMEGGALPPARLRRVVEELAAALHDVHAAGLVHRDLKPENILIRALEPLDLVLTDFSISSILDVTRRFTGVARTLPYASPESLSGVIDFKCDFWAMGMIVLECALGIHPFAGLSEPVVMHHLTTRNIDLSAVADRNVRKLLLGLLQRDPTIRWGADEVRRWLDNDTSLAEPAAQGAVRGFDSPYHLGEEICYKPDQLAVALARNWKAGLADLANGQLLTWFRDVQKDQNVVRLLLDMRGQTRLPLNVQLLKLILHLAPGIPPVWQDETIELSRILDYANKALKGETAAARWLDELYQYRVLEIYAAAGNSQAADLVQRWHGAIDRFNLAWRDKLEVIAAKSAARDPDAVVDFDEVMYGRSGMRRPGLIDMHARFLAMSYDSSWAERLRKRVLAELLGLAAKCDWINDLGDPLQMDASSLLVVEALLPEARKSVEHQLKKAERRQQEVEKEHADLRNEVRTVITSIRDIAANRLATPAVCNELRERLDEYFALAGKIRASPRIDASWQEIKKQMQRTQVVANILLERVARLRERRAVTSGWLSPQSAAFAALSLLFLPIFIPGIRIWLFAGIIGIVVWRLLPDFLAMKSIRELGRTF